MNYFTLFGLPISYSVDVNQLSLRYQDLQRQFHPDRFAVSSKQEKLQALQQTATINEAYQTLKQPLVRAEYMLSLHGFDVRDEQQTMHDTVFLMEQMELREELDRIMHDKDAERVLLAFADRIDKMTQLRSQYLQQQLDAQQWSTAADTAQKLRFLDKLQQQIAQFEQQLLDF